MSGYFECGMGNGSPLPLKATISTGIIIRMVFVPVSHAGGHSTGDITGDNVTRRQSSRVNLASISDLIESFGVSEYACL